MAYGGVFPIICVNSEKRHITGQKTIDREVGSPASLVISITQKWSACQGWRHSHHLLEDRVWGTVSE